MLACSRPLFPDFVLLLSVLMFSQESDTESHSTRQICPVCSETIGLVRGDGSTETQYILPCSHSFGNLCILRWLQDSPRQDCPHCRRRMVHSGCGHLIMPHDAVSAPPSIPEASMPAQCIRCRGEGVVAIVLRGEHGRLQAAEAALTGMQLRLPQFFGFASTKSSGNIDERIAELRKRFAVFHEKAWREFEEKERRERW